MKPEDLRKLLIPPGIKIGLAIGETGGSKWVQVNLHSNIMMQC